MLPQRPLAVWLRNGPVFSRFGLDAHTPYNLQLMPLQRTTMRMAARMSSRLAQHYQRKSFGHRPILSKHMRPGDGAYRYPACPLPYWGCPDGQVHHILVDDKPGSPEGDARHHPEPVGQHSFRTMAPDRLAVSGHVTEAGPAHTANMEVSAHGCRERSFWYGSCANHLMRFGKRHMCPKGMSVLRLRQEKRTGVAGEQWVC
jgi:hypothetical protein